MGFPPASRYGFGVAPTNPWCLVSAAEYEEYMGEGGVGEAAPLAAIFGKVYAARRPWRLAVAGAATGGGLEHVDPYLTRRTVALEVNLSFLAVARQRHMRLGSSLELLCASVEQADPGAEQFELVHAPLALERADVRVAIPRMASWLSPGGALTVVLHLPGGPAPPESPHPPVRALAAATRLVPPAALRRLAAESGLEERRAFVVPLPSGRRLFAALYERPTSGPEGGWRVLS